MPDKRWAATMVNSPAAGGRRQTGDNNFDSRSRHAADISAARLHLAKGR
jgi:hypothetical protein